MRYHTDVSPTSIRFCTHQRTTSISLQFSVEHPEETSKNSDICDFLKVSDIENEW